jgi:hypothetical protein
MHDEQGSSNAGDARGPVWRKVRWVDRRLDVGQTGGSIREGEGGQGGFSRFLYRRAVWAPFDERAHLHTRAGPRGKEPPLLLALPVLSRQRDALAHRWDWRIESSTGRGVAPWAGALTAAEAPARRWFNKLDAVAVVGWDPRRP